MLKHPFDFRFNLKFAMAQGRDLRLPRQFSGLTGRVPGPTPAAEDYESLVQHQRIWRHKDRADPVPVPNAKLCVLQGV